jgi:two-component system chemotaxis response regulator CheB
MKEARVLVVDDSPAMRALFCDVLERAPHVTVVGTAANADEARQQIALLQPNVLTLDVVMPGMSGIAFLAEIMATNPLPVVMLSSRTQEGSQIALRALELGAVECFPKPLKTTLEQFAETISHLGKVVLSAANSNVTRRRRTTPRAPSAPRAEASVWHSQLIALGASMGGIDALPHLLESFPEDGPPTVIVLPGEAGLIQAFLERLEEVAPSRVMLAADGARLEPGTIHIVSDPEQHAVFELAPFPHLRMVLRDPLDGARPSATLLFGTIARAGVPAVGAVLTGMGSDGARGLKLMRDAGCHTFAEDPASATVGEAPAAAIAAEAVETVLPLDTLGEAIVAACHQR